MSKLVSAEENCPRCQKSPRLCVCDSISPIQTRTEVLILQHPQEPDVELGTAKIAELSLPKSKLVVGLSWPNIKRAIGKEVNPKEWLVLYLGSAKIKGPPNQPLICVDRKGVPKENSKEILRGIKGLIVLDGTWSQAKSLWWRNAWITKLQRGVLNPSKPSLYGKLRREPRRESMSTIETIGICLSELDKDPTIFDRLMIPFKALLEKKK